MGKINYFNIIDFGLSNIRFSIFDNNYSEKFSISKSVLLNKDYLNHFTIITEIIKQGEKKISDHINDVVLTLDTEDLFVINVSLKKNLDSSSNLDKAYNALVLELNQLIDTSYYQYEIIHIILDKCILDEKIYNSLPPDKKEISKIKVDFKLICFPKILITKIKENFKKNNINVLNIFCTSYVKSLSYLNKLSKKKASFLEIGFNRTSLLFFDEGKLKFIQAIPIGGNHITSDISKIFKISLDDAEKIKRSFNKSETEFSYYGKTKDENISIKEILAKDISINLLKKVILYRVQEIIDLTFKKSNESNNFNLKDSDLFLVGDGSTLFNNNSFYLNDKFEFRSLNFYKETTNQICQSALTHFLTERVFPEKYIRKQGYFERFFNFLGK